LRLADAASMVADLIRESTSMRLSVHAVDHNALLPIEDARWVFEGTIMGEQRQSSSIRQQREMSRKLKTAKKRLNVKTARQRS
jgi:hypothetical protein